MESRDRSKIKKRETDEKKANKKRGRREESSKKLIREIGS